ncbi:unnamed protein product, partial [Musa acuminata subsp. burmannicoides]
FLVPLVVACELDRLLMVSDVQTPLRSPKRPFLSFSRLRGSEGKLKELNWATLPSRTSPSPTTA